MEPSPVGEVDPQLKTEASRRAVRLMIGLTCVLLIETVAFVTLLAWWLVLLGFGFAVAWSGIVLTVLAVTAIGAMAIRQLWRRRFRFDLRVMFALVSLAALVSWWLTYYVPKFTQEQRVRRAMALVSKYHHGTTFRQLFDGDDPLLPFEINFSGSKLTDGELVDLAGHQNVTRLDLRGSRVTDRGMSRLSRFPRLASLDVSETSVTAVGIAQLRHLPTLSILRLDGNQLRQLASVPDDALPLVHQLWLDSVSIDDQSISDLERWQNLDSVVVVGAEITDNGLAQLGRVTALTYLHVDGCKGVTDAGLLHLVSLTRLTLLTVLDTSATHEGGAKLHEALPACHLIVSQRGGQFYEVGPPPRFDAGRRDE